MKKLFWATFVVLGFVFVGAGVVWADYIDPLSLTNEYDLADVRFNDSTDTMSYLQQVKATPFNDSTDTFSSALLEIYTYKVSTSGGSGIGYKYGISVLGITPTDNGGVVNDPYKAISISSTFFDTSSGILSVNYIINYQNKDFYFDKSNLTLNWDHLVVEDFGVSAVSAVPEPATMLLLGTGLVGVAGAARKKKKNQA